MYYNLKNVSANPLTIIIYLFVLCFVCFRNNAQRIGWRVHTLTWSYILAFCVAPDMTKLINKSYNEFLYEIHLRVNLPWLRDCLLITGMAAERTLFERGKPKQYIVWQKGIKQHLKYDPKRKPKLTWRNLMLFTNSCSKKKFCVTFYEKRGT